ncbi:MAG: hypothetical protein IPK17_38985 [Chloroflexi bacterium]|uniref:hypothetical protein n=1 Tax=Candidatus Flexifilum breve TaxID=3140694 RepID=UPI003136A7B8|nr:hypothetical protein [Chloroflexota bacterium]
MFPVLHTAVTCAPKCLAICTAAVPTLPDAPWIGRRSPADIAALQKMQRGHRAKGGAAASAKLDVRRFLRHCLIFRETQAYSAWAFSRVMS